MIYLRNRNIIINEYCDVYKYTSFDIVFIINLDLELYLNSIFDTKKSRIRFPINTFQFKAHFDHFPRR